MLRSRLNDFQFALREKVLGKWELRRGLPQLIHSDSTVSEARYYSLLFKKAFSTSEAQSVQHILDVGCRNWSYLNTLAEFFPSADILGIELDARRRYWNLYRRMDYALAYVEKLRSLGRTVEFIPGDFCQLSLQSKPKTLYCFLFPFVSENPCLSWGLPTKYAHFRHLIQKSLEMSKRSSGELGELGVRAEWFSVHQGEWEAEVAERAYLELGFSLQKFELSPDEWADFWPSPYPSYLFRATL